jgi:GDSL-like Lipase/Acylhydrolase family
MNPIARHRSHKIGRRILFRSILVTTVASLAFMSSAVASLPANAASINYVALGDSYTAGAGILPLSPTASILCLQSAKNYPHLVSSSEGWNLTDASCSGATSSNMTTSQYPGVGPQFNALSSSTNVVTVGIGGNDNGLFLDALVSCGIIDIADFLNIGSPCKAVYGNTWADDIASDASTIAGVIKGIHSDSPNAQVFVVGYPDILPQNGNCYPTMPLTTGDTSYLNGVEEDLDSMLQSEASANNATYVNTFTPSIGHDACKSASVRWINPIIATNGGISVHPDPAGEAAMAQVVESTMASKVL